VEPHTTGEGPRSLAAGPYLAAAPRWASVTPMLCDRFPKDKDGQRIEDIIRESCRRVVGIEPVFIEVSKVSRHRGVPPSHAFFRTREPGAVPRHRVHVYLEFDRPVHGPLLVGAGRYFGLGLFRVWRGEVGP
jgi:CRISPR-associated protein Csb2